MDYTSENSKTIDKWCDEGWQWGRPIDHETFMKAKSGEWGVLLTPTKFVPHEWFGDLSGKKLLGLASGGGQQIPIFTALGAECTVLDYSERQCESERLVAEREGYNVTVLRADMTRPLPFPDESFDIIFHPVSNCYIEKVDPVFRECCRILKKGGLFLGGYDIGLNYLFDDDEEKVARGLPFNPLKDEALYESCIKEDWGIQFSHTFEEQVRGQLKAGFALCDLYEDTNGEGRLHELGVPTFIATKMVKA